MAGKTISIVCEVGLGKIVQDLIKLACSWAERYRGDKQDAQAMELALRFEFESARFLLLMGFSAYQELSGGTESFPWDQELQQAIEKTVAVFRQRFFRINLLYPEMSFCCRPDDVIANLTCGLIEACQPWLIGENVEQEKEEAGYATV